MCIRQGKGGYWAGIGKSENYIRKLDEVQRLILLLGHSGSLVVKMGEVLRTASSQE